MFYVHSFIWSSEQSCQEDREGIIIILIAILEVNSIFVLNFAWEEKKVNIEYESP